MIRRILFYTLFLATYFTAEAKTSSYLGADLSVAFIGNNQYKITFKQYRSTLGPIMTDSVIPAELTGAQTKGSIYLHRDTIKLIQTTCDKVTYNYKINQPNPFAGIEEHIYSGIADFNSLPLSNFIGNSECLISIGIRKYSYRNIAYTNFEIGPLFHKIALNLCANRADGSNFKFLLPVNNYGFYGRPIRINYGIQNDPGDSVVYRSTCVSSGRDSCADYLSYFSPQYPISSYCSSGPCSPNPNTSPPRGFTLDPQTGDIVFTPYNQSEFTMLGIEAYQFKMDQNGNYLLVSSTIREFDITVGPTVYNNPPTYVGARKYTVCEGDRIFIKFLVKDDQFVPTQTKADTVITTWYNPIPNSYMQHIGYNGKDKVYGFIWDTKVGDASNKPYNFFVYSQDNTCPYPQYSSTSYSIRVDFKPKALRHYDTLRCGKLAFKSEPIQQSLFYEHYWSFKNLQNNKIIHTSKSLFDTATITERGKYEISYTLRNRYSACETTFLDTLDLQVEPALVVSLKSTPDTTTCSNMPLYLKPEKLLNRRDPLTYNWIVPGLANPLTDSAITFSPTTSGNIYLRVRDKDGCFARDTLKLKSLQSPTVEIGNDQRICTYQQATFDAGNNDTLQYLWLPSNTNKRTFKTNTEGKVFVTVTNSGGCKATDSAEVFVNRLVSAYIFGDRITCLGQPVELRGNRFWFFSNQYSYLWRDMQTGNYLGTDSVIYVNPTQHSKYTLYAKVTEKGLECEDLDTVNVFVYTPVNIDYTVNKDTQCYSGNEFEFTSISTAGSGDSIAAVNWIFDGGINKSGKSVSHTVNNEGENNVILKVTSSKGCSDSTTLSVYTLAGPDAPVIIGPGFSFMGMRQKYFLSNLNSSGFGYSITNGVVISYNADSNYILVEWDNDIANGLVRAWNTDALGCDGDTANLQVNLSNVSLGEDPIAGVKVYPNPFNNAFIIESENSNVLCTLRDITGKTLWEGNIDAGTKTIIEVSEWNLAAGMYLLTIQNELKQITIKLIKN